MLLYMNLLEDYRQLLLKELRQRGLSGLNQKKIAEVDSWPAAKLFSLFYDNENRQVPVQRYTVHISKELQKTLEAAPPYRENLKKIIQLFEKGQSLAPYLSTQVQKPLNMDRLLLHWGLNHLHVSSGNMVKGVAERAGYWLFFRISGTDAYLVDVRPHQKEEMLKVALIEIVDRNWPALNKFFPSLSEAPPLSEAAIESLRRKNVTAFVSTERGLVLGGSGVLSSGASIEANLAYRQVASQFRELAINLRMHYSTYFKNSAPWVDSLTLKECYDNGYVVRSHAAGENVFIRTKPNDDFR